MSALPILAGLGASLLGGIFGGKGKQPKNIEQDVTHRPQAIPFLQANPLAPLLQNFVQNEAFRQILGAATGVGGADILSMLGAGAYQNAYAPLFGQGFLPGQYVTAPGFDDFVKQHTFHTKKIVGQTQSNPIMAELGDVLGSLGAGMITGAINPFGGHQQQQQASDPLGGTALLLNMLGGGA